MDIDVVLRMVGLEDTVRDLRRRKDSKDEQICTIQGCLSKGLQLLPQASQAKGGNYRLLRITSPDGAFGTTRCNWNEAC
jgi:hypothetical protein